MNGGQDLGGAHGHGPVRPEPNEPVFHAEWEKRVLALNVALGATGAWNIDMSRRAREDRRPEEYLSLSYYEIWLAGIETLLQETGLATALEIATGSASVPAKPVARVLAAEAVEPTLSKGWPAERKVGFQPRFEVGDAVVTRVIHPKTHTRLPRYARGKRGVITDMHGAHVFPDAHAHGAGEAPHYLYTVTFAASELWGPDTTADSVSLNCWEPYLEPVP